MICIICGFVVELDDVAISLAHRPRCICLACYRRETTDERPKRRQDGEVLRELGMDKLLMAKIEAM